ncbi:MAG TPA: IPExxxVDY family protein [Chitinophagaceae bacterium]|nr:IPExxxVDY family protein [Chitinophagaceae bacterium]
MKRLTLDIDEITEDFFAGTRLLGIVVSAKNYRFCWQVNNVLGYNFRLDADMEIELKKKERTYFFHVYHYNEPPDFLHHYIYHNHYDGEFLLPEFRHIDFLWLMKGEPVEDEQCRQLIKSLKSIPGVQLVTELTNEQIKNKGNLIL